MNQFSLHDIVKQFLRRYLFQIKLLRLGSGHFSLPAFDLQFSVQLIFKAMHFEAYAVLIEFSVSVDEGNYFTHYQAHGKVIEYCKESNGRCCHPYFM